MRGALRVAALLVRVNRRFLLGWAIGVVALVAVTIPGYAATYPSLASRGPLVEQLRSTKATEILYGPLPLPGTLGELAQWETGSYVMLLLATMGLLLATRLGRGLEQTGAAELIRATGAGRLATVAAGYLVQVGTFTAIGVAMAIDMIVQSRLTPEVTVAGGLAFAATFPLVGLGFGVSTSVLGEIFPDTAGTRLAAWAFVGAAFGLRIVADFAHAPWLRWFTWFGLRDLVGPFSADNVLPIVVFALYATGAAVLATRLHTLRSYGGGLVRAGDHSARRVKAPTPEALALLLERSGLAGWLAGAVAVAALFGGMSHGLINLIHTDSGTASMIRNLSGRGAPVAEYFEFSAIFVALVPLLCGISLMLRAGADEDDGFLDLSLSVGVRRGRPLIAHLLVSLAASLGLLLVAAGVEGGIAHAVGMGHNELAWSLTTVLARAPGLVCAVGLTALAVAIRRMRDLVWLLAAWSGFATLLGGLAQLPGPLRDASFLVGPGATSLRRTLDQAWGARPVLFLVLGVLAALAAVRVIRSRDIVRG